jgi:hypothetical protein
MRSIRKYVGFALDSLLSKDAVVYEFCNLYSHTVRIG